jgi:prepilin-type N-terminal cleavage/methylation domain-containing protein
MKAKSGSSQHGFTLVELMVGLLICLFSMLAMLSVYKTMVSTTAESKLGANIDGQIAVGLLAADRYMLSAGNKANDSAGQTSSYGNDVLLVQTATLSGTTLSGSAYTSAPGTTAVSGNALLWVINTSGSYQLQGIYIPASGGVQLLTATVATPSVAPVLSSIWSTSSWGTTSLIAAPLIKITTAGNAGAGTISIAHTAASNYCIPFGGSAASAGGVYVATLSATGYAGNQQVVNSSTCLVNIGV